MWPFKKNSNIVNIPKLYKVSSIYNEPFNNAYIDIKNYIDSDEFNRRDSFHIIVIAVTLQLCSCAMYVQNRIDIFKWSKDFDFTNAIVEENESKSNIPVNKAFCYSAVLLRSYDPSMNDEFIRCIYEIANNKYEEEHVRIKRIPAQMLLNFGYQSNGKIKSYADLRKLCSV